MHVQVSLTIEIDATASFTQMEEQIQQAGQQAMRGALKQVIRQWEGQNQTCPHFGPPCNKNWSSLKNTYFLVEANKGAL